MVVLDARAGSIGLGAGAIGETQRLRVFAGAVDVDGQVLELTPTSAPLLSLPPCHLRAKRTEGGDVAFSWVRRSRLDDGGWGVVDVPLDVVPEAYALEIFDGDAVKRRIEIGAASATYNLADQTTDFGGAAEDLTFAIAQISPVLGDGHWTRGEFHD